MPTRPFLEVSPQQRHIGPPADASDHTRYIRLTATVAPYIQGGVGARPTLGWKSNELATQARLIAPIYGQVRAFLPNRR